MDEQVLEDIGLKKSEIKTYFALLSLGESSAGAILQKSKLQNSVLHYSLNKLIEKGLVSFVMKGKFRVYKPASPESLVAFLEFKKKEIEKILPEIKAKQKREIIEESVQIFEGKKGILAALMDLIADTKPKDEFLFFSGFAEDSEKNSEIQAFYRKYDALRKEKKLLIKGIIPNVLKELYNDRRHYLPKFVDFPIPANSAICNDKMVLISWGEIPKAILIKSKQITDRERKFFNEIWEKS